MESGLDSCLHLQSIDVYGKHCQNSLVIFLFLVSVLHTEYFVRGAQCATSVTAFLDHIIQPSWTLK